MARIPRATQLMLINAIATKEGTAQELADRYGYSIKTLRSFVEANKDAIIIAREEFERQSTSDTEPTPLDLDRLWIANKTRRVERLQAVAELLYEDCMRGGMDAAALREFRSYCAAVANELGQLLHRGSGDSGSDTLNVNFDGVDMDNLR